ncbi:MAG TPA: methyltransferase domain-containing protein [Candidatus Pacearchaeota archaeon]|nr:class I SAM-dependent methyltransferase [Candidatus Parcubacteria bacterium]HOC53509.1 methyltransferase domain-containing protein [Candidatus Pacearchaeota archaeon]HQM24417.1 methyltransferase domain-containing protein [Candidatus Pacearchaeota archaeon]
MLYTFLDYILKDVRIKVSDIAKIKKQDRVLDVCCGTGDQAVMFSKYSDYVYGIDLDQRMINFAINRKSNVRFGVSYAEHLPFPDDYFDVVSITLALHEKDQELREKVFKEIKRTTKKDGRIIIADYNYPVPLNFTSFVVRTIEWLAGEYHYNSFKNYLSLKGLSNLEIKEQVLAINKTIKIVRI